MLKQGKSITSFIKTKQNKDYFKLTYVKWSMNSIQLGKTMEIMFNEKKIISAYSVIAGR